MRRSKGGGHIRQVSMQHKVLYAGFKRGGRRYLRSDVNLALMTTLKTILWWQLLYVSLMLCKFAAGSNWPHVRKNEPPATRYCQSQRQHCHGEASDKHFCTVSCWRLTLEHRILNLVELVALLFLIFTDFASRLRARETRSL